MALPVQPDNPGGDGGAPPGGGTAPAPVDGAVLSAYTTNPSIVFTADQITAAGGPWPAYKLRVTPINANGNGIPVEVAYPPPT